MRFKRFVRVEEVAKYGFAEHKYIQNVCLKNEQYCLIALYGEIIITCQLFK